MMTKQTLCYLFLDLDGVLVSQANQDNYDDAFGPFFDAAKVDYISALQKETGCRIVITSSWRNREETGVHAMHRMVDERQLDFEVYDTVEISKENEPRKSPGELIRQWLETHEPAPYCIIDDCGPEFFDMNQLSFLVQTHWSGMQYNDYQKALSFLKPDGQRPHYIPAFKPN